LSIKTKKYGRKLFIMLDRYNLINFTMILFVYYK